jgi:hypothetical protein
MKVTPFLIDSFAKWLVGGVAFSTIRQVVSDLDNEDISGTEKFDKAIDAAKAAGVALAGWMLNVAIELAVAWARSQVNGKN